MRVLFVFSNPPDQTRLRLDREDKLVSRLARRFDGVVNVTRHHASDIDDVHELLIDGDFDVVHFSGHGNDSGIYLEKRDLERQELVSASRLLALLEVPTRNPLLVILLSCYSHASISVLANCAPFVITSHGEISDQACLSFVQGFYERLFRGSTIRAAFGHAQASMRLEGFEPASFALSRRQLITSNQSLFIESQPSPHHDSVLINLDAVRGTMSSLGLTEEEICHLLARKMIIHSWIFDGPRESAVIPIGRMLFGEFSWENAHDAIYCTRLMKLSARASPLLWKTWARLLASYNDLASCAYRHTRTPKERENSTVLSEAVTLFRHHIQRHLGPCQTDLAELGALHLAPHIEMAIAHAEQADDGLQMSRFKQVIIDLELALTNYHEVANGLQPPLDSVD